MHTEDLIINKCCKWQEVHDLSAVAPHIYRAVFPQTLIIESINLSDLSAFVVTSDQGYVLRVAYLQS